MKFFILLVLLGLLGMFLVQNLQLMPLQFFGGILSLTLPIGVWIILFALAGLITSLLLQFLASSFRASGRVPPRAVAPPPTPLQPEPPRSFQAEPPYRERDPLFDDWGEGSPPVSPPQPSQETVLQDFPQRKVSPAEPSLKDEEIPSFEVEQAPQKVSQQGTIYSYTYREAEPPAPGPPPPEAPPQKPQQVYDADYRVITPPYRGSDQTPPKTDEDEEEWI